MSDYRYLSAAETAKLIRIQLKKAFPTVKFYVNSETYSGGASINIHWIDGPAKADVEKIVGAFNGAEFDGMTDYKTSNQAWLLPDGSAMFAKLEADYFTTHHYTKPHPEAELVKFASDFIFCNRHYTPEFAKPVIQAVCAEFGVPEPTYYERNETYITRTTKAPCVLLDWDACSPQWRDLDYHISQEVHKRLNDAGTKPAEQKADAQTAQSEEITITWDRDWTWVSFPKKPSQAVLDVLKNTFGARFSSRRTAWYICERVAEDTIRLRIAHA